MAWGKLRGKTNQRLLRQSSVIFAVRQRVTELLLSGPIVSGEAQHHTAEEQRHPAHSLFVFWITTIVSGWEEPDAIYHETLKSPRTFHGRSVRPEVLWILHSRRREENHVMLGSRTQLASSLMENSSKKFDQHRWRDNLHDTSRLLEIRGAGRKFH